MAGGGIVIGDHVLYAQQLIHFFGDGESFVLKFDQIVHFYGFFVTTFLMFHLLKTFSSTATTGVLIFITAALASMGLSVMNEIVEFTAVVIAEETGVGGYFNTALDLVFNTLGAATAAVILYVRERRKGTSVVV